MNCSRAIAADKLDTVGMLEETEYHPSDLAKMLVLKTAPRIRAKLVVTFRSLTH